MSSELETKRSKTTKSGVSGGKAPRFNNTQFVQYELDKVQQAELKGLPNDAEAALLSVNTLVEVGYKISIKWDTYSSAYACFMQQSEVTGPNAGYTLTSRGSSVFKALKQLLYKHFVCLEGEWGAYVERKGADDIDD